MNRENYFGGDAMTGNRLHKGYKNALENKFDFLTCFKEYPTIHEKFKKLWTNVPKIYQFLSLESPSEKKIEEGALECEKVTELFPVEFPSKNITRKLFVLSFVLPKMIRKQKIANKILRVEQEGEHLHQLFNSLENKYKSVSGREERFWFILTEYENKLYITDSLFQVKKMKFKLKYILRSCIKRCKFF